MSKATLVIMAAGIGSRFGGGIKQLAPVGPNGEIIMDYSIYDALEAGFDKVVFVIRKDLEKEFKEVIGNRIEKHVEVAYAYQELDDIPGKYRDKFNMLEEIRIKANVNIILKIGQADIIVDYITNQDELLQILQTICDNSIYSYQSQICNGYITLKGGHRVGISGEVVIKDGQVINISYIYSLNFRIARQVPGCSNTALPYILNVK